MNDQKIPFPELGAAIAEWVRRPPKPFGEADHIVSPHLTAESYPFALGYLCAECRAVQRERDRLQARVDEIETTARAA